MGISTHILDTALGQPASEVRVSLLVEEDGAWTVLSEATTDADGRVRSLLPEERGLISGTYRVHFETAGYYTRKKVEGLYPYIEITFTVADAELHLHIPLLLTANGYTTYKGT